MKKISKLVSALALVLFTGAAFAAPEVGQPAPDFNMIDTNGNQVSLAELKGKVVVMEWTNHGCPYVKKHYNSDNMQALQQEASDDGVVWVTVISSAPGKQGFVDAQGANEIASEKGASPAHLVLDPEGTLGQRYAARTTPHMFVINKDGDLAYMGGIDDKPTADRADIEGANNYVRAALSEIQSGTAVSTPTSRPYGCSVKYAS